MAELIYLATATTLPHALSNKPGVFPIFWKRKELLFRTCRTFNELNEKLDYFTPEVCERRGKIGEQGGYVPGTARGYLLTDRAKKLMEGYLALAHTTILMDAETGFLVDGKPYRPPQFAIRALTSTGAHCRFKDEGKRMESAIVVDGEMLHKFYSAATRYLNHESAPKGWEWLHEFYRSIEGDAGEYGGREWAENRARRGIAQSSLLLDAAKRSHLNDYILYCSYVESTKSGRLHCEGVLNLQNCLREVKVAALAGHWDYDLDCAHYAILSQMASRLGVETPAIDHYIANKRYVREHVAKSCGISIRSAKFVLTALIYGAKLTPFGEANKVLGTVALAKLKSNEFVLGLCNDIKDVTPVVLDAYKGNSSNWNGVLINDAGRTIKLEGDDASILAFLLQGAESEILKACMGFVANIKLLSHDGFVTSQQIDIPALRAHIAQVNGYEMNFTETELFKTAQRADEQE